SRFERRGAARPLSVPPSAWPSPRPLFLKEWNYMKRIAPLAACFALLAVVPAARAYVEVPYTLGRICQESTTIVVVEVAKVNKEKGLIIYKKLEDLKGKHPTNEIKHNIGQRGYHAREWQNVMAWAETGKKAIFFHNGGASETCTGTYWYQCYPE